MRPTSRYLLLWCMMACGLLLGGASGGDTSDNNHAAPSPAHDGMASASVGTLAHTQLDAALFVKSAFALARDTGDFWGAQKLLSAAVHLEGHNPKHYLALGDVEAKLGRPGEALVAWETAIELDRRAIAAAGASKGQRVAQVLGKEAHDMRVHNLESVTSEWRLRQAMEELEAYRALMRDHAKASTGTGAATGTTTATGRGGGVDTAADAQSCNERGASESSGRAPGSSGRSDASDASDGTSDETSDVLLSFWATPLVVVNVTKRRVEMGATLVDHTRLRHLASEAFDEANSYEPLVSDEHGQLTPNNQLFEWQSKSRSRRDGAQLLLEVVRTRGCRLSLQSHPTPPRTLPTSPPSAPLEPGTAWCSHRLGGTVR